MMMLQTVKEEKQNLTFWIPKIRTTENKLNSYKSKAKEAGLSLSEFVRQALDSSIIVERKNALEPIAVAQLSAIGNNLNQLVRNEHIHGEADTEKMRDLLETIDRLILGLVDGS